MYGPITYDLASLLRDAFISWEEDFVIDIAVRYWEKARKAGLLGSASHRGWADFGGVYRAVEMDDLQRHPPWRHLRAPDAARRQTALSG